MAKKSKKSSFAYGSSCDVCGTTRGPIWSFVRQGQHTIRTRCKKHLRRAKVRR